MHSGVQTQLAADMGFQGFPEGTKQISVVGVGGPIVRQYLDDFEGRSLQIKVKFKQIRGPPLS